MTARQPLLHLIAAVAALLITSVSAHEPLTLHIAHRAAIRDLPAPAATTQSLELRVVNLDQWPEAEIHAALRSTAQILGQCGIRVTRADLLQVTAPETHRHFDTPRSRASSRERGVSKWRWVSGAVTCSRSTRVTRIPHWPRIFAVLCRAAWISASGH